MLLNHYWHSYKNKIWHTNKYTKVTVLQTMFIQFIDWWFYWWYTSCKNYHIFLWFTCLYLHWGSFDQLSREDQYFAVTYDELYFLNFLYATRTCNYDISAYNLQLDQNMFYSIYFQFYQSTCKYFCSLEYIFCQLRS